ncbi:MULTISPECIES: hypothetical protein [Leptospira]|uniref:Uncharacterized protein n=4 Tax=Leptospira borgpetersenii TaxID=174 RepID=M3HLX3_LEPBO|nr:MULTISPECIES: hypothetical protein [Leptospira]EMF98654.1 hypothetical protein LEP1GSC123_2502 [Leptospira borgpetersenii str. 200701203]EMO09289.1 hypothetical protein LEP1GSC137_2693 [Leptospira borgpetersenii str. Noumea 25]ALO27542.1 hypothetical protein LBBP_03346 [Leptospira borgpetersenii serovar Ballum]ANH01841.1 Uncharacterized protein LB4E_2622 [Leptospira borgpetersenii str. 4E]AXX15006.1 hypothetical protein C4Q31_05065 [Leptospira borgpetersenii serovar Ceylonica]
MVSGITLIVLSILAVPSLLLAKKPDAKELLAKISPYQGWIGLVFFFWGIYGIVFQGLLGLGMISTWPIYWVTLLAGNIVQTVLGFILGFGTISTYVLSKNEEAKKKGAELLAKLAPIQGKLGIIGIAVGVWTIIAFFLKM